VLPIGLLVLVTLPRRPRDVPIGSYRLWAGLGATVEGGRRWRRPDPRLWLTVLALVAAIFALARPVELSEPSGERYTVLVDRSASMGLPVDPSAPAGATRHAVALAALSAWAAERALSLDAPLELEWSASDLDGPLVTRVLPGGASVPPAALARPFARPFATHDAAPPYELHDRAGVLWLTDRGPEPLRATAFFAGGAACPGPIGEDRGRLLVWDGDDQVVEDGPVPSSVLQLDGSLPEFLVELVSVFAAERGWSVRRGDGVADETRARLTVRGPMASNEAPSEALRQLSREALRVGRDGWSGRARDAAPRPSNTSAAPRGGEWLHAEDGRALVRYHSGAIEVDFATLTLAPGTEAAAVASWAQLFDTAAGALPDVVALAERRAAGAARVVGPGSDPTATTLERGGGVDPGGRLHELRGVAREFAPLFGALAAALAAAAIRSRTTSTRFHPLPGRRRRDGPGGENG